MCSCKKKKKGFCEQLYERAVVFRPGESTCMAVDEQLYVGATVKGKRSKISEGYGPLG